MRAGAALVAPVVSLALVGLASTLTACSAPPGEDVAAESSALVDGTPDPGDPAVVSFVDAYGASFCSGVLVAPDRAASAAHCFASQTPAAVRFGADDGPSSMVVRVTSYVVHPAYDAATLSNDVAYATLASPVSVTPIAVAAAPPGTGFVGGSLRVVGFGESSTDGGDGVKRAGDVTVASLGASTFQTTPGPAQPCHDDSGGPALSPRGEVVGLVSSGDAACSAYAVFSRADVFRRFLLDGEPEASAEESPAAGENGCAASARSPATKPLWVVAAFAASALAAFGRRARGARRKGMGT